MSVYIHLLILFKEVKYFSDRSKEKGGRVLRKPFEAFFSEGAVIGFVDSHEKRTVSCPREIA